MIPTLNLIETRVLGCLGEKELATPEYYPLTLNALVNACNQKSNREPVLQLEEETVALALEELRPTGLVTQSASGGRAAKYCHNLSGKLILEPTELALIIELMLRGPQTAGELRQRARRMVEMETLQNVEDLLEDLLDRQPAIICKLPRQPGRKEQRFAQLLSGPVEMTETTGPTDHAVLKVQADKHKILDLEQQLETLRVEMQELRDEFQRFRQQFE